MLEILGYIASIFIGFILGVLGGGGSILSIPILVYLFNINAVLSSAYSLFIVGITSLVGAIPKYRDHLVNIRTGLIFGIPSIIAIFITRKWLVPAMPDVLFAVESFEFTKRILMMGVFAILMIVASVAMINGRHAMEAEEARFNIPMILVEGILIGFLTGLVGAGGGFLIIPALVLLTGLPFKTAVGTSLFIISTNSLIGFMGDIMNYSMDWNFLFTITGLAIFGIIIGNFFSSHIPARQLRQAFGWFTLIMGTWILAKEIFFQ